MRFIPVCVLLIICGCKTVPVYRYDALERKLNETIAAKNDMKKRAESCEDHNRQLIKTLRAVPIQTPIEPTELEEIKKKAFEEAENKYRIRIKRKK